MGEGSAHQKVNSARQPFQYPEMGSAEPEIRNPKEGRNPKSELIHAFLHESSLAASLRLGVFALRPQTR
jgi:hypothetical protein